MFRVYLFIGGLACTISLALPIFLPQSLQNLKQVQFLLQQFVMGMTLFTIATLLSATEKKIHKLGAMALNISAATFTIYILMFIDTSLVSLGFSIPIARQMAIILIKSGGSIFLPFIGSAFLMLSAFRFKQGSYDSNSAHYWVFLGGAACAVAPFVDAIYGAILVVFSFPIISIATLITATEEMHSSRSATTLNVSAMLFAASCSLALIIALIMNKAGNPEAVILLGGITFLGAWATLAAFASTLENFEGSGDNFRPWLRVASTACAIAVGLLIVFGIAAKSNHPVWIFLPIGGALLLPGLPLLFVAALLAATKGKRWVLGTTTLEVSAFAFVMTSLLFLYMSVVQSQHTGWGQPRGFDELAKVGGMIFLAGWAALALSAFGFKAREA